MYSACNIQIKKENNNLSGDIIISGSKSISNRLLILKAIYPNDIYIKNLSNCEDTKLLENSLLSSSNILDINHAGTAMRFLTSYLSIIDKREVILTGSKRMKERPIYILVNALNKLGAKITYLEKIGYPPIKIFGKKILGGEIEVNATISSQYISALMLIASKFDNGLKIILKDKITSIPYINMTFHLLNQIGIKILWNSNFIQIYPGKKQIIKYFYIESDWSSASYYYSMAALSKNVKLTLKSYTKDSIQGDKEVCYIYKKYFGISTIFSKKTIMLQKSSINFVLPKFIHLDLNKTPDIAQTIAVTCSCLRIKCLLNGLETLKIKETDRLQALKHELYKFGIKINITNSSLEILDFFSISNNKDYQVNTYQDHRMAMAFSAFSLFFPINILKSNVVEKSYPLFWKDLYKLGFVIQSI
ncbi:3-phosphoshikimate 1-carboxyvinyltransferase [Blattabacterium cuenoti]|uniref:3-phosphoshikimate 1-carboxyvinyltransferase n=1 Tax=Blattabacterium cuenoti TaxID=1653831 RepID=UPI00163C1CBA|nr:3-phosphoshikimate 1-carboxyvinyltransferase [Blattabacterium cuenoti]